MMKFDSGSRRLGYRPVVRPMAVYVVGAGMNTIRIKLAFAVADRMRSVSTRASDRRDSSAGPPRQLATTT
jgi:hypothetical protein